MENERGTTTTMAQIGSNDGRLLRSRQQNIPVLGTTATEDQLKRYYLDYCRNLQRHVSGSDDDDDDDDDDHDDDRRPVRPSMINHHSLRFDSKTATEQQPNDFDDEPEMDDDGGQPPAPPLEDGWLDSKLQASFKQLNAIILGNGDDGGYESEIFFLNHANKDDDDDGGEPNFEDSQHLLQQILLAGSTVADPPVQNLYCLVLTRPNKNRDSLVFAYPSADDDGNGSNPIIHRLTAISAMFVTLFDVMAKLRTNPAEVLSAADIDFDAGYGDDDHHHHHRSYKSIRNELHLSFVIDEAGAGELDPVILVVALPANQFGHQDSLAVARLVSHLLRGRFGSLSKAARSMTIHTPHRRRRYLDKIFDTVNVLLATVTANEPGLDLIGASLALSNTFFLESTLVHQHLHAADETIVFNLCKYLNDYDSLDWIDESIQFYKNGHDIEQALSEHFARCLQFGSADAPSPLLSPPPLSPNGKQPLLQFPSPADNDHRHHHSQQQQNMFDLLEVELTFFTVIGSCLFHRGFLVQTHLPGDLFHPVKDALYARGILAATKHGTPEQQLVYFSRFYPGTGSTNRVRTPDTDLFLLIMGHGHMVHCSLLQVYRFDRSGYGQFVHKYTGSNGGVRNDSPQTAIGQITTLLQLPSSFAFYVFIKESFRLLHYYLGRFRLQQRLDQLYQNCKEQSQTPLVSVYDMATQEANTSWLDRLNPFNLIRRNSDVKFSRLDVHGNPRKYRSASVTGTMPTTITTTNNCDKSSGGQLPADCNASVADSLSTTNSIYSHSTMDDSISFCHQQRFRREYHPETLVCFLNLERRDLDATFYGPIVENADVGDPRDRWLATVTVQICRQMIEVRHQLRSLAKVQMKRRERARVRIMQHQQQQPVHHYDGDQAAQFRAPAAVKTVRTVQLAYAGVDGRQPVIVTENGKQPPPPPPPATATGGNHPNLHLYILGRCDIEFEADSGLGHDSISGEFYACFRRDPSLSTGNGGSFRTGLRNIFSETWNAANDEQPIPPTSTRPRTYEMDQLDVLMADLDELIQNVRMENQNGC